MYASRSFHARTTVGSSRSESMPGWCSSKVAPEQAAEISGDRAQRGVVEVGRPFAEVLDEQVADRPALNGIGVDDLLDAAASVQPQYPQSLRSRSRKHAGLLQRRVEPGHRPVLPARRRRLAAGP